MENSYLNFIGYDHQDFYPKIEMGLEEGPSYSSIRDEVNGDYSMDNEPQNLFSNNLKSFDLMHNIFDVAFNPALSSFEKPKIHPPFKIIRLERAEKKEENSTSDETSVSIPIPNKIADRSRRIIKREKAKQRTSVKNVALAPVINVTEISDSYASKGFEPEEVDDKSKKKMVQMIRNRISAQNSRDRKKAYMKRLEQQQKKIASDNLEYQREIRQLKNANEALKLECEHLRRCLMTSFNETHDKLYQSEENMSGMNSNEEIEFKSGSLVRKNNGSKQLVKYSLALATLFAVLMFSNINIQSGNSASNLSQLGQQLNTFESKIEEIFYSHKRKLEELSNETSEHSLSAELKIEMEEETLGADSKPSNNLEFEELKKLKAMFHEEYMTKFMNQMKVNTAEGFEVKENVSLPKYLKESMESQKLAQNSISNGLNGRDNYSALFCPSGFAVQSSKNDSFSVKLEDGQQNERGINLNNSEWLQLIVPKSNLLQASFAGNEQVKISSEAGSEDNSLIELWCKVVNVKTLQSGF